MNRAWFEKNGFTHAPAQNQYRFWAVRGFAPRRKPEEKDTTAVKPWGFTIIEVIVTLAVVGIVSTFLYTILYGNWIGYNREIIAADLQFDARNAMGKITKDIREAENVVLDSQNPHSLTLTLAGVNVVYGINTVKQLTRQEGTAPTKVLCENINQQNSGFKWVGPRTIDIDIQLVQSERIFDSDGTKNMQVRLNSRAQRRCL